MVIPMNKDEVCSSTELCVHANSGELTKRKGITSHKLKCYVQPQFHIIESFPLRSCRRRALKCCYQVLAPAISQRRLSRFVSGLRASQLHFPRPLLSLTIDASSRLPCFRAPQLHPNPIAFPPTK